MAEYYENVLFVILVLALGGWSTAVGYGYWLPPVKDMVEADAWKARHGRKLKASRVGPWPTALEPRQPHGKPSRTRIRLMPDFMVIGGDGGPGAHRTDSRGFGGGGGCWRIVFFEIKSHASQAIPDMHPLDAWFFRDRWDGGPGAHPTKLVKLCGESVQFLTQNFIESSSSLVIARKAGETRRIEAAVPRLTTTHEAA